MRLAGNRMTTVPSLRCSRFALFVVHCQLRSFTNTMHKLKLCLSLDALGLSFRKAVDFATRLDLYGVKVNALGSLSPEQMSQSARREFRNILRTRNLELCSIGCVLRHGLDNPENLEPRMEFVRQVMTLAYDLGPRIVTLSAGAIADDDSASAKIFREALRDLSHYGDRVGTTLALESGRNSGEQMSAFLKSFDSGSLAVNFDPANQIINGFQPIADLRSLHGMIIQIQAKDAKKSSANRLAHEVSLGQGDLDWMLLLGALEEMDYRNAIVVTTDHGGNQSTALSNGVSFLKRFLY